MDLNLKLNRGKFRAYFDEQSYKILPTSILIEIALHFREKLDTFIFIRQFLKDRGFILADTGTARFLKFEYEILFYEPKKEIIRYFLKRMLPQKAASEAGSVYAVINSIMGQYFIKTFCKHHHPVSSAIAFKIFKAFDAAARDFCLLSIEKSILDGYETDDVKKSAKTAFLSTLENWFHTFELICKAYNANIGVQKLSDSRVKRIIKASVQELKDRGLDADKAVYEQLSKDRYFTSDQYVIDLAGSLAKREYSMLQSKYMVYIARKWLKSRGEIDKNDFFDLYFLGILDRKKQIFETIYQDITKNINILDDRIVAITFDNGIRGFLERHDTLSFQEIQQLYHE